MARLVLVLGVSRVTENCDGHRGVKKDKKGIPQVTLGPPPTTASNPPSTGHQASSSVAIT
eukprot:CCRYP_009632-RB/>CCRYP_009632-RB protein AED:0.36 eAED:0.33 QI:2404/0/0.5/1/1/1/2/0/59